MKPAEIDQKIGMPDIDKEWAKFEAQVIDDKRIALQPKRFMSRAASVALLFGLGFVAVASTLFVLNYQSTEGTSDEATTTVEPLVSDDIEPAAATYDFDPEATEYTFDGAELQEIAACIEMLYGVKPSFATDEAKHIRMYATIDKQMQLSEVVALLNNLQNVQFYMAGNKLIIQ